jgi:hypothetical protein
MKVSSRVGVKLGQFITRYRGNAGVGDTPGNRGQCVGLVEVWTDLLGLPHTWGNAKDLLDDADPKHYTRTANTPTNYPLVGDVVVWGSTWGGGYGHTGIVVTAYELVMTVFQQNDPEGSTPHLKTYGYAGVLGWLHPLVKL